MTKQKLFVQLHQTDLAVYLADGTVGKAGGTLGTGFQHTVHIGFVSQNAAILGLHGGQGVSSHFGNGQLEITVTLAGNSASIAARSLPVKVE